MSTRIYLLRIFNFFRFPFSWGLPAQRMTLGAQKWMWPKLSHDMLIWGYQNVCGGQNNIYCGHSSSHIRFSGF